MPGARTRQGSGVLRDMRPAFLARRLGKRCRAQQQTYIPTAKGSASLGHCAWVCNDCRSSGKGCNLTCMLGGLGTVAWRLSFFVKPLAPKPIIWTPLMRRGNDMASRVVLALLVAMVGHILLNNAFKTENKDTHTHRFTNLLFLTIKKACFEAPGVLATKSWYLSVQQESSRTCSCTTFLVANLICTDMQPPQSSWTTPRLTKSSETALHWGKGQSILQEVLKLPLVWWQQPRNRDRLEVDPQKPFQWWKKSTLPGELKPSWCTHPAMHEGCLGHHHYKRLAL